MRKETPTLRDTLNLTGLEEETIADELFLRRLEVQNTKF